jgi:hypothetical protein
MGTFICPDIHEHALLNFVEKLKRPRKAVLTKKVVRERISGFLKQEKIPVDEDVLKNTLIALEDLGFIMKLTDSESFDHNSFSSAYLIPSLRPFGNFRWFDVDQKNTSIKTLGRRLFKKNKEAFLSFWFCDFQVENFQLYKFTCLLLLNSI